MAKVVDVTIRVVGPVEDLPDILKLATPFVEVMNNNPRLKAWVSHKVRRT